MIGEGWWKPKRAKKPSVHQMRERRACFGELVQIDGSDHDWFEGRAPKLHPVGVYRRCHGAAGRAVVCARRDLLRLLRSLPALLWAVWQASRLLQRQASGIFRVNQPRPLGTTSGLTQFGRAMQELDVQIICANTPQAKGRIERANQTLQDRLVKELRLRGISDIDSANAILISPEPSLISTSPLTSLIIISPDPSSIIRLPSMSVTLRSPEPSSILTLAAISCTDKSPEPSEMSRVKFLGTLIRRSTCADLS